MIAVYAADNAPSLDDVNSYWIECIRIERIGVGILQIQIETVDIMTARPFTRQCIHSTTLVDPDKESCR